MAVHTFISIATLIYILQLLLAWHVNYERTNIPFSLYHSSGQNGNPDTETMRLPYEEEEFLHFVDNQQLPPVLSELLQQVGVVFASVVDSGLCSTLAMLLTPRWLIRRN